MLLTIALLSFATADVAAQGQTARFAAARAPLFDPPSQLSFTVSLPSERDNVSYSFDRIAFSMVGAAVGLVTGGLAGVALTNNPYGSGPPIGAAIGSGTGAAFGLLLPGGAPGPVVRSTVLGTALGAVVTVAGDRATEGGGITDILWTLSSLVGAHIGFALAISP